MIAITMPKKKKLLPFWWEDVPHKYILIWNFYWISATVHSCTYFYYCGVIEWMLVALCRECRRKHILLNFYYFCKNEALVQEGGSQNLPPKCGSNCDCHFNQHYVLSHNIKVYQLTWHVSLPPSSSPAHIMDGTIPFFSSMVPWPLLYSSLHKLLSMMLSTTFSRISLLFSAVNSE